MREVRVLEPLVRVSQRLGVDLILFGSAASRIALLSAANDEPRDLFEVAEHASDIDLAHTGPPSLTNRLRSEIDREFPLASWLRWSIVDASGWASYQKQQEMNFGIPLRRVHLATHPSLSAPQDRAVEEALDGRIEFTWNEAFGASPRAAFDTEASAALIHLDALLDVVGSLERRDRKAPVRWDQELTIEAMRAGAARLARLEGDSGRLAARRLWYRFATVAMRFPPIFLHPRFLAAPLFGDLLGAIAHRGFAQPMELLMRDASRAFVVSAALGNGRFRFDAVPEAAEMRDEEAHAAFRNSTAALSASGESFELASGHRILHSITRLEVNRGDAPSEGRSNALPQEFVHLSLTGSGLAGSFQQSDLTAIVIGHSGRGSTLLPAYAIVSRGKSLGGKSEASPEERPLAYGRTTIRLNLAGMLDEVDHVDVFLVGAEQFHEC